MTEEIGFHIQGIKCDATDCTYEDNSGEWGSTKEEIIATSEKYLAMDCPECGEPLLTKKDYDSIVMMLGIADILNDICDDAGIKTAEDQKIKLPLAMDGSGKVGIGETE